MLNILNDPSLNEEYYTQEIVFPSNAVHETLLPSTQTYNKIVNIYMYNIKIILCWNSVFAFAFYQCRLCVSYSVKIVKILKLIM